MIALALVVAVAPVPIPLPAPTLKALQALVLNACEQLAWQTIWPWIIVVGQFSDFLLATAPGGCVFEARGSKNGLLS